MSACGMLLEAPTAWKPRDAAVVLHKAVRYAGFDKFVPNEIWSIWRALASQKVQGDADGQKYVLSDEVVWQIANRWLGSRARCAALFSAALLATGRRNGIMRVADVERREQLAHVLAKHAAKVFGSATHFDDASGGSQEESDDSCAVAEFGWTEWSWCLP